MPDFANSIMELRYSHKKDDGTLETWEDIAERVVDNVFSVVTVSKDIKDQLKQYIKERKFIPGGRFLAQAGRDYHQTNNCFLLRAEDSREGWSDLAGKSITMLMSGGGIGVVYSDLRPKGSVLKRSGGTSSGVVPAMNIVNEIGRGVMSGGNRRSAIWGGLHWWHKDIFDFITAKNWSEDVRKLKEKDYNFPASLDMTNISVILDKDFFSAYENNDSHAVEVYNQTINRMVKTSEPGFSVDYNNSNESLRNARCEIVSEDDSDVCCLGSINLGRINSSTELAAVTYLAQLFLIVGTEYSDVPHPQVKIIRNKNRRTGLGLLGIHEWLISRGYSYAPNEELSNLLNIWKNTSDESAKYWSNYFSFNEPIAKRAIAPNGSISIAGGKTTSGIEPIYSVAYQRRYLTPTGWKKQYVIDPVAERLVESGVDPYIIEDAYSLSFDVERRINFQAYIQSYVDNAISSTINLPQFGTENNNDPEKFGKILYPYLPKLRGITVYADGSRSGQPLEVVDFKYAMKHKNKVFEGNEECSNGVCAL